MRNNPRNQNLRPPDPISPSLTSNNYQQLTDDIYLTSNTPSDDRWKIALGYVVARPHEYLIHSRGGKLLRNSTGQGGRCFKLPGDMVILVPTSLKQLIFEAGQLTLDNIHIRIRGFAIYRISQPEVAYERVSFYNRQEGERKLALMIGEPCRSHTKWLVSNMTLEDCMRKRKEAIADILLNELQTSINEENSGVTVETIDIQDIRIEDDELFRAYQSPTRETIFKQQRLAEIERQREVETVKLQQEQEFDAKRKDARLRQLLNEEEIYKAEQEQTIIREQNRREAERQKTDHELALLNIRKEQEREQERLVAEAERERQRLNAQALLEQRQQEEEAALERQRLNAQALLEQRQQEEEAALERQRLNAQAALEQRQREEEAALERQRLNAQAALEQRQQEEEAALERQRLNAQAALEQRQREEEALRERQRLEAEAARERNQQDAEANIERQRLEGEAARERQRLDTDATRERQKRDADAARERTKLDADNAHAIKMLELEIARMKQELDNTLSEVALQRLFYQESLPEVAKAIATLLGDAKITLYQGGDGAVLSPISMILNEVLLLAQANRPQPPAPQPPFPAAESPQRPPRDKSERKPN